MPAARRGGGRRAAAPPALADPVAVLRGVGPRTEEWLHAAGIRTVQDLVQRWPRRHEDRRRVQPPETVPPGGPWLVEAWLLRTVRTRIGGAPGARWLLAGAPTGPASLAVLFPRGPYMARAAGCGQRYRLFGPVSRSGSLASMIWPDVEPAGEEPEGETSGGLVPVYPGVKGLSARRLRGLIRASLPALEGLPPPIPPDLRRTRGLLDAVPARQARHWPASEEELEQARRALAYEELLDVASALAVSRLLSARASRPALPRQPALEARVEQALPHRPTPAQRRAADEVLQDLARPYPMRRLLHGDVGSGKTLVVMAAMLRVALAGSLAVMLAPTELLARQGWTRLAAAARRLDLPVVYRSGSLDRSERRAADEAIRSGSVRLAVGTHSLLDVAAAARELRLVVVDEQHRFGVAQRLAPVQAGARSPDLLVTSATPIPRTLALAAFGDLDCSPLDAGPAGERRVRTRVVPPEDRGKALAFLRQQVSQGAQALVVCPRVERGEAAPGYGPAPSVREVARYLARGPLQGVPLGVLHGRLPADRRDATLESFRSRTTRVLVASTVVEVGLDVPDLELLLVVDADRFGLAALHQLRGRVGRRGQEAHVLLLGRGGEADSRLELVARLDSGLALAEADLARRGPGDFFGFAQHGLPPLEHADLCRDRDLVDAARADAARLVVRAGEGDRAAEAFLEGVRRRAGSNLALPGAV